MTATEVGGRISIDTYWIDYWLQIEMLIEVVEWEKRIICPRRVEVPRTDWLLHVDLHHIYGKDDNYNSSDAWLQLRFTLRNEAGKVIAMNSCTLHPRDEAWQNGDWSIAETTSGCNLELSGILAEPFTSSVQMIFRPRRS